MRSLGVWEISAYEDTGNCTASGIYPYYGVVAFNHAPLGARVYISGLGEFVVLDRCGIDSRCDIYLGDYQSCINFGITYAEIFIYE